MGVSAQHQRRKSAKAARRKVIVAEKKKAEAPPIGMAGAIRQAASSPIACCVMPTGLFELGIGHVIVARELPSGRLGCGFFLVDTYCLGIKDTFYREMSPDDLQARLGTHEIQTFADLAPACARKLLRDAAAYAADLGLAPAKDYRALEAIFGDVDAGACTETFTFGRDGKPFYATGPLDTPARIRVVTRTLQQRCGTDGWHYMIGLPPEEDDLEEIEFDGDDAAEE